MKNCFKDINNNKGYSLVEVMIVIALLCLLTGLAVLSYASINNANVSKAANNLDSAFAAARAESMAKGADAGQLTLSMQHGKLYYQIGDPTTATMQLISNSNILVYYQYNDPISRNFANQWVDGVTIVVRFNSAGMVETTGTDLTKVIFKYDTRNMEVILYPETGKHETGLFYF